MKERYIFCPANMKEHCRFIYLDPDNFSDGIYAAIDCYIFEHVYVGSDLVLIVDECGKIKDPPKPINLRASMFYSGTRFGDPIVGDVIFAFMGIRDGEPDIVPIPDVYVDLLTYRIGDIDEPSEGTDQDGTAAACPGAATSI